MASSQDIIYSQCIYCGSAAGDRGREHIIPSGLGGLQDSNGKTLTLLNASCRTCEVTIGRFESDCINRTFQTFRFETNTRSIRRNKPGRRELQPIPLMAQDQGGNWEVIPGRYDRSGLFAIPMFQPPGILFGGTPDEVRISGAYLVSLLGPAGRQLAKMGTDSVMTLFEPSAILRMVAKIGYCYALHRLGPGSFEPEVLPFIRGECFDNWLVGHSEIEIVPPAKRAHICSLSTLNIEAEKYVQVKVWLFAKWGASRPFQVVVGKALA